MAKKLIIFHARGMGGRGYPSTQTYPINLYLQNVSNHAQSCYMVVVRKTNGSPRRTVDMQKLNAATLREIPSGSFLSEGHDHPGGHVQNDA